MIAHPLRRIMLGVAVLCLLVLAWNGLIGGLHQLPQAQTTGQKVQTITQLAYGVLSLLGIVTTFRGPRWNPVVLASWAVSVTAAAGFATVAWGGASLITGMAAAGAAFLIAAAIIWMLRVGTQGLTGT